MKNKIKMGIIVLTIICGYAGFMYHGYQYHRTADGPPQDMTSKQRKTLSACNAALRDLEYSCGKGIPVEVTKPTQETDYVGTCLYSMGKVYHDRFPLSEHATTRPDFFFECLKSYPQSIEEFCCAKQRRAEKAFRNAKSDLKLMKKQCQKWCDRVKRAQWEDCNCQ